MAAAVGGLFQAPAAQAQFVQNVNGLYEQTYVFQCCGSNLQVTNNYPTLARLDETYNTPAIGADHANRHELLFSSNGGSTPRTFNNNESFDISVDVNLETGVNIPRKEAGIRVNWNFQDGLFAVMSNEGAQTTGEIVAFGGPFPFFSFDDTFGIRYVTGTPITLRMIYNKPGAVPMDMPGTIEYLVNYMGNSYTSGQIEFTNTEKGVINGSQAGAFMQATPSPSNPTADFSRATFTNFTWGTGVVGLDGDFNKDGSVDAADYVVWRKNDGSSEDYNLWVMNFGRTAAAPTAGGGSDVSTAVPEPAAAGLALIGMAAAWICRRRR